jgi:hypothetical protein
MGGFESGNVQVSNVIFLADIYVGMISCPYRQQQCFWAFISSQSEKTCTQWFASGNVQCAK